jgi:cytoskeleton protein RodZ
MHVGAELRATRQALGMALDDIAATTRIPRTTLEHIEHDRFDRLPGGIITRGYLRAFAAHLDLNPDRIVEQYLAQCFGTAGEELPMAPRPAVESGRHPWRTFVIEALAIVVTAILYASYTGRSVERQTELVDRRIAADHATELAALQDTPTLAANASADTAVLHVEIEPSGACWVSVVADDRRVIYELLQAGDRVAASARRQLVLRVGDPEVCNYRLNGLAGRPLGPSGTPATVRITPENYEAFVDTAPARSTPITENGVALL